jgi:uncharacterized LabA/DUF88 family protein
MPNTYVYIDGFNLYYGALKRTPYKWLDLAELSRVMLPNDKIESIQYFTARVSARPHNPSAPLDQQVYLRALRTIPNLTITLGHFRTHAVPMMLTGVNSPKRVFVDKTEEKGSDVNLAAHLLRDVFTKRFAVAVLVTNDSDLAEPVRIRQFAWARGLVAGSQLCLSPNGWIEFGCQQSLLIPTDRAIKITTRGSRQGVILEIERHRSKRTCWFFLAAVLRILPEFSAFCRAKCFILLSSLGLRKTLDLRIGVRVPASQPAITAL